MKFGEACGALYCLYHLISAQATGKECDKHTAIEMVDP